MTELANNFCPSALHLGILSDFDTAIKLHFFSFQAYVIVMACKFGTTQAYGRRHVGKRKKKPRKQKYTPHTAVPALEAIRGHRSA